MWTKTRINRDGLTAWTTDDPAGDAGAANFVRGELHDNGEFHVVYAYIDSPDEDRAAKETRLDAETIDRSAP